MEKNEFTTIRKRLGKTQKALAEMLGVSLKAISSYEQGWRNIPGHVERQLLFLLSRKHGAAVPNCWEIRACPDEVRQQCPAWEFAAGNLCWFINGTVCDRRPRKDWQDKMAICRACDVFSAQLNI